MDWFNLYSNLDSTPTYKKLDPTPQVIEKKVVVEQGLTIAISVLLTNRDIHVMDSNNHSYTVHVRDGVITTSQIT